MDCAATAVMKKAGLGGGDMLFFSSPGGYYQQPLLYLQAPSSSSLPAEEAEGWPVDRCGGGAWEDFSVNDLLDLGGGKEQNGGEDEFLRNEEAEYEEEERKDDSSPGVGSCSSSVLSFQAPPPAPDPIVPAGDVADLEWVSHFVDDSFSEFPSAAAPSFHNHHVPTSASPKAVVKPEAPGPRLATGAGVTLKRTWGSGWFSTDSLVVPAKARSKRSRTGGRVWSLRLPPLLAESSSSSCSSGSSAASCSASHSIPSRLLCDKVGGGGGWGTNPNNVLDPFTGGLSLNAQLVLQVKKKKGRKPKAANTASAAADGGRSGQQLARRRCSHCGVDKTPQWRAGPLGAKTLCNACGVRYKSGRLLPEYRPAESPTFLSHVHSNSHRKVLEMRSKKGLLAAGTSALAASCALPPSPAQLPLGPQPYGVV